MRVSLFAAALALCAVSVAAHADAVNYTLTGVMSGTLGTDTFTDANVTFTFLGDTANIVSQGSGFSFDTNSVGTGTVTIDGLGTAIFLSSTFGVESFTYGMVGTDASVGFADIPNGFQLGILDFNLANYDLTAPFTDTNYFVDGFTGVTGPESTSLGDLTITDGDFQNPTTTFTASSVGGAVPEPSSLMLLGTGLAGLIGVARRRLA